jgi:hypothetical protein
MYDRGVSVGSKAGGYRAWAAKKASHISYTNAFVVLCIAFGWLVGFSFDGRAAHVLVCSLFVSQRIRQFAGLPHVLRSSFKIFTLAVFSPSICLFCCAFFALSATARQWCAQRVAVDDDRRRRIPLRHFFFWHCE